MSIRLLVRARSEAGGTEKPNELVLNEETITLGRDPSCQVVLTQQAVSRQHARISRDGPLFFIEDLGSAYGTQVNNQNLPKGEKRLLRNGDVIAIAQFDVTFDRLAEAPGESSLARTSMVARNLVKDVMRGMATPQTASFRIMNGPREGERIEVNDGHEMVIGREEGDVDVLLTDDLVSRRHVKIRRDWSGTHVEDLGSRNGIRVNRRRVQRKTLKDQDELEIGSVRLLYLDASEVRETPLVLPGEDDGEATQHQPELEPEPEAEQPPEPAPVEEPKAKEPEPPPPAPEPPPKAEEPDEDELPESSRIAARGSSAAMDNSKKVAIMAALGVCVVLAIVLVIAVIVGA